MAKHFYGIDELFALQEGRCYLCGGLMYLDRESAIARATIDHVIPLCRGGTNDDENRKAAHRGCNVWKRDALLEELPDLF
jgi:5-methylcytosine-specific restriction endonuclease McrA